MLCTQLWKVRNFILFLVYLDQTQCEYCHCHLYSTEHWVCGGGFSVSVSPLPDALLPATWRKRGNWEQISFSSVFGFFWQELKIKLKRRVASSKMRNWPREQLEDMVVLCPKHIRQKNLFNRHSQQQTQSEVLQQNSTVLTCCTKTGHGPLHSTLTKSPEEWFLGEVLD